MSSVSVAMHLVVDFLLERGRVREHLLALLMSSMIRAGAERIGHAAKRDQTGHEM